jgi:hypothetical protein
LKSFDRFGLLVAQIPLIQVLFIFFQSMTLSQESKMSEWLSKKRQIQGAIVKE